MPSKARLAVGAYEEWHRWTNGQRLTYPDLLPTMLNLDDLQTAESVVLSDRHRRAVEEGMLVIVQDSNREHQAQPATEVKAEYQVLERALAKAYKAAAGLGPDAALCLDVKLKTELGIDRELFHLIGQLRMLVRLERQSLRTAKQPDVVQDLVQLYRPIYLDAGGKIGISATGPFVESIEVLNEALPSEYRAAGTVGDRVKNAVEEAMRNA